MQGFNMGRYVPPDIEGRVSFNQASGKGHALGKRAGRLKSEGILTVRFECPFAIWCTHCDPEQIIGQGVRFNAEKKKVGNYHTTPIWSFRFKHTLCGKWIEVRTDPKNAEYVVMEGGRRRDTGVDKVLEGEERIGGSALTEEEKERLEKEGGFGMMEKKVEDKRAFLTQQQRIDELVKASDRDWSDPFEMSRKLRREFRVGRRKRQADEKTGEALKTKFGIGIEMLEEKEEDRLRARLVDFGSADDISALSRPLFPTRDDELRDTKLEVDRGKRGKDAKPGHANATTKARTLHNQLRTNTRAVADPFLRQSSDEGRAWRPSIKRKRSDKSEDVKSEIEPLNDAKPALVSYDSDST
ncbi:hypothetical protein DV737_g2348, partial [Chaetothyriales sp. CBS 132003]